MNTGKHLLGVWLAACAGMSALQSAIAQPDISSFAFVQDDGALKVAGYLIRLYGIYIPPTAQTCLSFIRPK